MNGAKGRARQLKAIRNRQRREAVAAGVNPNDREAYRAWRDAQFRDLCARIIGNGGRS